MSGLTPLLNALLAATLAQRSDPLQLKAGMDIAAPGAADAVGNGGKDARLALSAAVDLQADAGLPERGADGGQRQPVPDAGVRLSAAARIIGGILAATPGAAGAVRGSAPIWPQATAPAAHQLAPALARAVTHSGLFYESHLRQFAAGARSLAELSQEPQARLGLEAQARPGMPAGSDAAPQGMPLLLLPAPAAPAVPVAQATDSGSGEGTRPDAARTAPGPDSRKGQALTDDDMPAMPQPWQAGRPASHAAVAAYAAGAGAAGSDAEVRPASPRAHDEAPADAAVIPYGPQRHDHAAAIIHPDAAALVRQQLELLAAPVFRWNGEAWPDARMDWEVARQDGESGDLGGQAGSAWATRVRMTLPKMGVIDARLELTDIGLQVRLEASEESSLEALNQAGDALRRRMAAAGLRLNLLQLAPAAGAQSSTLAASDFQPVGEGSDG